MWPYHVYAFLTSVLRLSDFYKCHVVAKELDRLVFKGYDTGVNIPRCASCWAKGSPLRGLWLLTAQARWHSDKPTILSFQSYLNQAYMVHNKLIKNGRLKTVWVGMKTFWKGEGSQEKYQRSTVLCRYQVCGWD